MVIYELQQLKCAYKADLIHASEDIFTWLFKALKCSAQDTFILRLCVHRALFEPAILPFDTTLPCVCVCRN